MPSYEAVIEGKTRQVELTKTAQNTFTAKIDNKPHKIELETEKLDPEQTFAVRIDGKTYKVQMPKIERGKIIPIKVEEATFRVEVRVPKGKQAIASFVPAMMAPARKATQPRQVAAEGAITAPMTGKIVLVKVKNGDQVKTNQTLCIVEAMKMENEITAPRAGTVQAVNVSEGQPVNEGDTLFIVA
jgi:glutaconyl-CoA decarboxylase